jgi:hypothetical protein
LTGALLGGVIGAAIGFALAGAPGGIVSCIGKSFLKAGTKSVFGKFTSDLMAYVCFGKEIGSLESYMSAFVFGGSVGALGLNKKWRDTLDVFLRPAYSILVDDMLFRGIAWSHQKYVTNVFIRGLTYSLSDDLKPISRGFLNGLYYQYSLAQ